MSWVGPSLDHVTRFLMMIALDAFLLGAMYKKLYHGLLHGVLLAPSAVPKFVLATRDAKADHTHGSCMTRVRGRWHPILAFARILSICMELWSV